MRAARWITLLSVIVLGAASTAHAIPPSAAAHVDPKAPCYRWPAVDCSNAWAVAVAPR